MQQSAQALYFTTGKGHRYLLLDLLRGMAAVMVALLHAPRSLGFWLRSYNCYLAVDLFFVLSGFVIGHAYEKRLAQGYTWRNFAVARLIRLYPLYFLATLLGLLVPYLYLIGIPGYVLPSISLTSILCALLFIPHSVAPISAATGAQTLFPFDVPAWSLACELAANLLYAALARCRLAGNLVLSLLALVSFALLAHFTLGTTAAPGAGVVDGGWNRPTLGAGFFRVGYSFFAGILVFRFFAHKSHSGVTGRFAGTLAIALCIALFIALGTPVTNSATAQLLLVGLAFPIFVYIGACVRLPSAWKTISTFCGDASYPLYVLQLALFAPLNLGRLPQILPPNVTLRHIVMPCLLVTVTFISWWLGRVYDFPIRKFLTARYNAITSTPTRENRGFIG